MLAASPALAAIQEMRVVGVGIDPLSTKAEALALDYAKKRAAFLATRKMGVKDAGKALSKLSAEEWQGIIRGATITQSRRDGYTTYIEAQVSLMDDALRRALKLPEVRIGTPPTDYDVRGVLLLSAYVGKDRAFLWEKDNVLRGPVSDEIRRQSRGTVLLPGGDLDDLRLIDYQNALTVSPEEMKPMFVRYGAEEIIVAILKLGAPGSGDASQVILRRLRTDGVRNETMEITVDSEAETVEERIQKAASAIAGAVTQIATSTAERDTKVREAAPKLVVRFIYSTPRDLAKMQQAVLASPEVLALDMPNIALSRVAGTVYLKGEQEALRESLIKQGVLVTSISDGWRLSMR